MLTPSIATLVAVATLATATTNIRTNNSDCASIDIRPGDSLGQIARSEGVTVQNLIDWNTQIPNPDLIFPGERVCVTPPVAETDKSSVVEPVLEQQPALAPAVNVEREPETHTHTWTGYNKATKPARGPQPGAIALHDAILERVPGTTSLGIYNPRRKRGGTGWSLHAEGRAVDIGLTCDTNDAYDLMIHLAYNAKQIGIQRMLVCEFGWDNRQGLFEPSSTLKSQHTNPSHLHIGLNDDGAANLTHDQASEIMSWLGG